MPFAKVGAMPQPTSNKQRNGHRKSASNPTSRPKGITMEDLKKQTALRLAQEQQQKQGGYYADPARERPAVQPHAQHLLGHGPYIHPQSSDFVSQPGSNEYPTQRGVTPVSQMGHACQTHPQQDSQFNPLSCSDTQIFSSQRVSPIDQIDKRQQSPSNAYLLPVCREITDPPTISHYSVCELTPSDISWPQPEVMVAAQQEQGLRKQKLPHGLTVSELKEMTKARLQAEAAEKPGLERSKEHVVESRRISPLDFDSLPEFRDRAPSRDSGRNDDLLHRGPGSTNSIPSLVQVNQQPRESFGRQPQVSPLPAVFHNSSSSSAFHPQKSDAWESISIASHNSAALSENYGSESVISSGIGSGYAHPNELDAFCGKMPLFTGQQAVGLEELSFASSAHTSPCAGNVYFDAAIGINRRRAMTSSPRTMSIHEDRQILHGDELRMPTFSSSNRATLQSRPSNNYSPVLGFGLDEQCHRQHPGLAPLGCTDLNRPRTFSATSVPLRSQGAYDVNRDRANTFNGFSAVQSRGDGLTDSESNALTESFLRVSRNELESGQNVTHASSLSGALPAPPGFFSSNVPLDTRNQLAGFATAQTSDLPRQWVDGMTSSLFDADFNDLADTMGSILKLSGLGSDRPDRERSHTYPYSDFR